MAPLSRSSTVMLHVLRFSVSIASEGRPQSRPAVGGRVAPRCRQVGAWAGWSAVRCGSKLARTMGVSRRQSCDGQLGVDPRLSLPAKERAGRARIRSCSGYSKC